MINDQDESRSVNRWLVQDDKPADHKYLDGLVIVLAVVITFLVLFVSGCSSKTNADYVREHKCKRLKHVDTDYWIIDGSREVMAHSRWSYYCADTNDTLYIRDGEEQP